MVRVAGLRRQVAARVQQTPPDGLTAREQLDAIERRTSDLLDQARRCLHDLLLPALAEHGVRLLTVAELSAAERESMDAFFETHVFPVLTPLAVDPGHPFPYISNLSLSLAVQLREPEHGQEHFARVKVPKSLARWVPVDGRPNHFVPLEQVIAAHLGTLFPGMQILGSHSFRITRYSDLEIANSEEPEDLLAMIEEQVFQRRFGEVVRLEVPADMPPALRALLLDELRDTEDPEITPLTDREVHTPSPLLDLGDLMVLTSLDLPDLKDPPLVPSVPAELREGDRSIFDAIRERDGARATIRSIRSTRRSSRWFIESAARRRPDARDQDGRSIAREAARWFARSREAAQRGASRLRCWWNCRRDSKRPTISTLRARSSRSVCTSPHTGLQGLGQDAARRSRSVVRRERAGRIRRYSAHQHRQLQREDRPDLHRPRPLYVQPGGRRRRERPVQHADRILAPARVSQADRCAARHAPALPPACRTRGRARHGRPSRAHHREDERARGRGDDQ